MRAILRVSGVLALTLFIRAKEAWSCATCFGAADSAQTEGMNMAILGLLVIIGGVLAAFASFFIQLARRSRLMADGVADSAWHAHENRHSLTQKEQVS